MLLFFPNTILSAAFATVVAIEAAQYMKTKNLVSYSEQQLVSCDTQEAGCDGGDQLPALKWLAGTPGICTEGDYPYSSG